MDFRLPADLVTWQQQVREFVRRELQPHDDEIERSGVVPKDLPIERIWREVRVVRILDGTSEMMRRIVARQVFREADAESQP